MAVGLHGSGKAEFEAINKTGQQVLSSPPLPADVPVVSLTAPDRSGTAMTAFDNEQRRDLGRLYPQAIRRELHSAHLIQKDPPQVVVDNIRDILRRVHPGAGIRICPTVRCGRSIRSAQAGLAVSLT